MFPCCIYAADSSCWSALPCSCSYWTTLPQTILSSVPVSPCSSVPSHSGRAGRFRKYSAFYCSKSLIKILINMRYLISSSPPWYITMFWHLANYTYSLNIFFFYWFYILQAPESSRPLFCIRLTKMLHEYKARNFSQGKAYNIYRFSLNHLTVTLPYMEIKRVCHDLPLRNLFTQ